MTNQDEADRRRHELIEKRAYEIYQKRGRQDGLDEADWELAEHELNGFRLDEERLPDLDDEERREEI